MDTKKDAAASDAPTFKIARVGKDRKRKGGALSFLRGGGARGAFSGATGGAGAGGSGAAGMFASSFAKTMLSIMLASGIGAAAMGAGYMGLFGSGSEKAEKKPEVFSSKKEDVKLEGDTSNLPSSANTIPNSMGYVSGSTDGLTPEERAKKAAEAAEAERLAAEAEAKKKAEEDAAAKANAAVDPNALLASAQKDGGNNEKGSAFGKKFGALSSSMGSGSGLAGGAGMAGGVGRSFGGMGSISKGSKGNLSGVGTTARPTMKSSASSKVAKSNVKGFARQQLANANALSRRGMSAGKSETAAYDASSAFDNNQGAGNVISGAGIGKGTKPAGEGDGSQNANTTSQPVGNNPQVDCGANNYQDADGKCQPIPTPNDKDDTKNAWMYKAAMGILAAIVVLTALWWVGQGTTWAAGAGAAIMQACVIAMLVLSLALTALGIAMIAATGDKMAGGILTLTGAFLSYMVYYGTAATASSLVLQTVVPAILGGFAAAGAHKTPASSQ